LIIYIGYTSSETNFDHYLWIFFKNNKKKYHRRKNIIKL